MTSGNREWSKSALRMEHAALYREIDSCRKWWRELSEFGTPRFGEMGDRLSQFCEHLGAHFNREEREGFLAELAEQSSDAARRVRELRSQHDELLASLDRLVSRLRACEPEVGSWGDAKQEFEAFLDRLHAHEREEDALIDHMVQS